VAIFNRRNAFVGWLTWAVAKRTLKRRAKEAVPAVDPKTKRPNKNLVALVVATAAGVAAFWRRRWSDDDE
jgi:hypothetical protein